MSKHALSFIELHNQLFMQGSNLGNKINASQRQAKLLQDDERGVVWVFYKGRVTSIPLASVASADFVEIPSDIKEALGLSTPEPTIETPMGPPAIARGRRAKVTTEVQAAESIPEYDINDNSPEAHRARVRAASANAFKSTPIAQNDLLIQQARMAASGSKSQAQVSNPTQPKEGASVAGKPKALSHAQLRAQMSAEDKA